MLVTTAPFAEHDGLLRREDAVDAERLHEPAFLVLRAVAGRRPSRRHGRPRASASTSSARRRRRRPACRSRRRARSSRPARHTAPRPCCGRRCAAHARSRARRSGCRRPCRDETSVVVPQPSVREVLRDRGREAAGVREDRDRALAAAISSGWSPPSAPPMRTRFHESATPRQLPPMMSTPLACAIARISRASCTDDLLGDDDDLLQIRVDADQLGHAVAHARRRQVDDAGVEARGRRPALRARC